MFDTFSQFPTTTALCCAAATIGVALYDRRSTPIGLGRIYWNWAIGAAAALALLATLSSPAWREFARHLFGRRSASLLVIGADGEMALLFALSLSYLFSPFGVVCLLAFAAGGDFRRTDGERWGPTARAFAAFAANVAVCALYWSRFVSELD